MHISYMNFYHIYFFNVTNYTLIFSDHRNKLHTKAAFPHAYATGHGFENAQEMKEFLIVLSDITSFHFMVKFAWGYVQKKRY